MAGNKNLEVFMTKLIGDEKLLSEMQAATEKDPEKGAYKFALAHSDGGFSEDEFKECVQEVLAQCTEKVQVMGESQLENVAGGVLNEQQIAFAQKLGQVIAASQGPSSSVEIEAEKGKWGALQAGINSLGNAAALMNTLGNIWATYMSRKDQKSARKVETAINQLKLEQLKAEMKNKYGYSDEQINEFLENV